VASSTRAFARLFRVPANVLAMKELVLDILNNIAFTYKFTKTKMPDAMRCIMLQARGKVTNAVIAFAKA
jgi:hypothetical protein